MCHAIPYDTLRPTTHGTMGAHTDSLNRARQLTRINYADDNYGRLFFFFFFFLVSESE